MANIVDVYGHLLLVIAVAGNNRYYHPADAYRL